MPGLRQLDGADDMEDVYMYDLGLEAQRRITEAEDHPRRNGPQSFCPPAGGTAAPPPLPRDPARREAALAWQTYGQTTTERDIEAERLGDMFGGQLARLRRQGGRLQNPAGYQQQARYPGAAYDRSPQGQSAPPAPQPRYPQGRHPAGPPNGCNYQGPFTAASSAIGHSQTRFGPPVPNLDRQRSVSRGRTTQEGHHQLPPRPPTSSGSRQHSASNKSKSKSKSHSRANNAFTTASFPGLARDTTPGGIPRLTPDAANAFRQSFVAGVRNAVPDDSDYVPPKNDPPKKITAYSGKAFQGGLSTSKYGASSSSVPVASELGEPKENKNLVGGDPMDMDTTSDTTSVGPSGAASNPFSSQSFSFNARNATTGGTFAAASVTQPAKMDWIQLPPSGKAMKGGLGASKYAE